MFIGGFGFADPSSSITGTIRGNRIRDLVTVGDYPLPGIGIVMFNPYNLEVAQNTVENVNVGMAANQVVGAQITRNQIAGPGPDVFGSSGLLISGMVSSVLNNRFRKFDTGILLFVDDPQLGSATNTVMDDNNFDGVAMDVMTSPGTPMGLAASEAKVSSLWTKLPHR